MKKHRCQLCNYQTDRSHDHKRHVEAKHKNYQQLQAPPSYPQLPLHGAATVNQFNIPPPQQPMNQPVYHQPVYYQQPLINGSVQPENAQPVYHQAAYLGGYDQGGYLSDVGTQTSVQSDDEEPDISELITDVNKNFMDIIYIKKNIEMPYPSSRS